MWPFSQHVDSLWIHLHSRNFWGIHSPCEFDIHNSRMWNIQSKLEGWHTQWHLKRWSELEIFVESRIEDKKVCQWWALCPSSSCKNNDEVAYVWYAYLAKYIYCKESPEVVWKSLQAVTRLIVCIYIVFINNPRFWLHLQQSQVRCHLQQHLSIRWKQSQFCDGLYIHTLLSFVYSGQTVMWYAYNIQYTVM